jgi:hydroxymethylpyrimidine/phosphomethylpyrimidine kinase
LILLTIADALEVSALGVITNLNKLIDMGTSAVTSLPFMQEHKETNPLNWIIAQIKLHFTDVKSLHVLVGILIGVAVFKAIALFLLAT